MQNTRGGDLSIKSTNDERVELLSDNNKGKGYIETAYDLFNKFGPGVFFDGIQPKLYRAAVNHSVTFYIYDLIMRNVT